MSFDDLCRAAGRRILATMTAEERAANDLDMTDPIDVCCRVAAVLSVERQSFDICVDDVEARLRQLAGDSP
jgi:hypothetical protein